MKTKKRFTKQRVLNSFGTEKWHEQIDPICRIAANNRGFIADATRRLQAAGFPNISQQQVRQWLVLDRLQRAEPRWGVGDVLLEVLEAMTR